MYTIEAVVRNGDSEYLVLNKYPEIKYEKNGNFLFGICEEAIFANCYEYEPPKERWKAFAGRKFEIPLTDGTFEQATGQWWDGGHGEFAQYLGQKIIKVAVSTKQDLLNGYCYFSLNAVEEEYLKLRNSYTGKIYRYYEYEKIIKKRIWNPENLVRSTIQKISVYKCNNCWKELLSKCENCTKDFKPTDEIYCNRDKDLRHLCDKCSDEYGSLSRERREGDICKINGCLGTVELIKDGGCSCHINPPCSSCEKAKLVCDECEEEF